jgi:hypothetical protein
MENSDVEGLSIQDLRKPQNMSYRKYGITVLQSGKPAVRALDAAFQRYVPKTLVPNDTVNTPQLHLATNRKFGWFLFAQGTHMTSQLYKRRLADVNPYFDKNGQVMANDQQQPTSAGFVFGNAQVNRVRNSNRFNGYSGNAERGQRSRVMHALNASKANGARCISEMIATSQTNPIVAEARSKSKQYNHYRLGGA